MYVELTKLELETLKDIIAIERDGAGDNDLAYVSILESIAESLGRAE